jgi:hypothetical protein
MGKREGVRLAATARWRVTDHLVPTTLTVHFGESRALVMWAGRD